MLLYESIFNTVQSIQDKAKYSFGGIIVAKKLKILLKKYFVKGIEVLLPIIFTVCILSPVSSVAGA